MIPRWLLVTVQSQRTRRNGWFRKRRRRPRLVVVQRPRVSLLTVFLFILLLRRSWGPVTREIKLRSLMVIFTFRSPRFRTS